MGRIEQILQNEALLSIVDYVLSPNPPERGRKLPRRLSAQRRIAGRRVEFEADD